MAEKFCQSVISLSFFFLSMIDIRFSSSKQQFFFLSFQGFIIYVAVVAWCIGCMLARARFVCMRGSSVELVRAKQR